MLGPDRVREIRALALEAHDHDWCAQRMAMADAIEELLREVERLQDEARRRRAEDDTREVPT